MTTHFKTIHTTCAYCGVGCGLQMVKNQAQQWKARPDSDHPANLGRICQKGSSLGDTLGSEGRILSASFHGETIDSNAAIRLIADCFLDISQSKGPDAIAFYVSGQLLTEDYYVTNKFVKGVLGTANIDTNSRLCMASSVAGHKRAFGADLVSGSYQDLDCCNLAILIGSNMAECHPVLYQRMMQREPKPKLIVIDPRKTPAAYEADLHLALKPGSDVALFQGLVYYIAMVDAIDPDMLPHLDGLDELLKSAASYTPSCVAELCGLGLDELLEFYRLFVRTDQVVSLFSQGVNQSSRGTDKVNAILNAHLITGKIGKPGSTPFSLTGQCNAMGGREVGGLANQLAAHMDLENPQHRTLVQEFWNSPRIAQKPGLKAVQMFEAMAAGQIKAVWIMATNPLVSLPDRDLVKKALRRCEFVVVSESFESSETLAFADVILPTRTWGEKDGTVTNSERRISRQRAFLPSLGESRADWEWVSAVAGHMGYSNLFPYQKPAEIFREHASLSGYRNQGERIFDISGLSLIDDQKYERLMPIQWPVTHDKPEGTQRLFTDLHFPRRDFRANLQALGFKETEQAKQAIEFPLVLTTGRVKDHWHTMTRTSRSSQLNQAESSPSCQIHPEDLQEWVETQSCQEHPKFAFLRSKQSKLLVKLTPSADIRRGTVFMPFHWGDYFGSNLAVNQLTKGHCDPISGQPELKWTAVRLEPYALAYHGMIWSRQPIDDLDFDWWAYTNIGPYHRYVFADHRPFGDCWQWLADTLNVEVRPAQWGYVLDSGQTYFRAYQSSSGAIETVLWLDYWNELPQVDIHEFAIHVDSNKEGVGSELGYDLLASM